MHNEFSYATFNHTTCSFCDLMIDISMGSAEKTIMGPAEKRFIRKSLLNGISGLSKRGSK